MRHHGDEDRRPHTGRMVLGLWLTLLGVTMLLAQTGLAGREVTHWVAPLLLVAFGLWKLLQPGCRGSGLWLLVAGGLLLAHLTRFATFRQTWPVFVVAAGAAIIVEALDRPRPGADEGM